MLVPASRLRKPSAAALAVAALMLIGLAVHDRFRSDRLDVWFASVGQGDAAIVRMPGGKVWVIDEGPPGRGRMVMAPLLRRAWIGRIDVLVASHVQSDHAGALAELLDDFEVGEIWLPDGPCDVPAGHALLAAARAHAIAVRFVSRDEEKTGKPQFRDAKNAAAASSYRRTLQIDAGTVSAGRTLQIDAGTVSAGRTLQIEAATAASPDTPTPASHVEILWPPSGAAKCNDNDQSLVLRIGFAGRSILFTGDIEAPAEQQLASDRDVHADVLKVPHHGSRTSSSETFLSAVRPELAIASLGLDNQFHFPAPEVTARYAAHDATFLRTDETGAVHLTIDSEGEIRVETFHSRLEARF